MRKLLLLLFFITIFFVGLPLSAQDNSSNDKKNELSNKIQEYEQKLSEIRQQKKSLSSQIEYMDTQISLTSLKIQETEEKIISTQDEINLLTAKIDGLDSSLNYLSRLFIQKLVARYKRRDLSILTLFLDSQNTNDFLSRYKYLKTAEENNQKLLIQVQESKFNFEEQKSLREEKKKELSALEDQFIVQKNDLNYQKQQKQILLTETQNDEQKYQDLLAQALAEYNAIQNAIATGSKVGEVKKGDPIALLGNSGYPYCSTGPHLHFEIRVNDSWVNPEEYLSSKTVEDNQNGGTNTIGRGSWDWPVQDQVVLEQYFGQTPWSWRYTYSGGTHTGLDIWSRASEVIRAPADGTLYASSQSCSGAVINVKYIDHGNGLVSFYLHVQ